jgi:AAA domain
MSLLPVEPAWRLADRAGEQRWLVTSLWSEQAVGIIGGEPKCCKSFLALDLAVAAAADLHFDASARRQAAVSRCLQETNVQECIEPAVHGHKTEALVRIEPFDDCVNRLPPLLRAWLRPVQPPSGKAIRGGVIVVVTAALGLAVIVVAAHLIVHEQS